MENFLKEVHAQNSNHSDSLQALSPASIKGDLGMDWRQGLSPQPWERVSDSA